MFTHTEVDDRFEGQGVGSALARFALDDVRAEGTRRVVPRCPFIKGWIDKHPDYADLTRGRPRARRGRHGLSLALSGPDLRARVEA